MFFSGRATVNARPDRFIEHGELQGALKIDPRNPDMIMAQIYSNRVFATIRFLLSTFDDDYTVVQSKSGHTYLTNIEQAAGLLA
jgi:hypothetical protein